MRQKGNRERGTGNAGNQIFSGVLIFDDSLETAISLKGKSIE
ncbi:hypothetical protein CKA32_000625 [Geitlerinema sp. FC II]|nr:hypothetical protein CKA32_000625 [Geitlerinema sp. FC II]